MVITHDYISATRMKAKEFSLIRKKLSKTQEDISILLGVALKTVQSYEQGIRNIPVNIERILYFLLFKMNMSRLNLEELCWEVTRCPENIRRNCIAWISKEGFFCWFLTGKTCLASELHEQKNIQSCFDCRFFKDKLRKILSS